MLVAQSWPTLCHPMESDSSVRQAPLSREFSRQEYWKWSQLSRVWLFVSPQTVPHQDPLSMDSSAKNTGVGCDSLLQGNFPTQGLNPGLPHCRQTLYRLSHKGSPLLPKTHLTSHSRMSGSRKMTTPSWLSRPLRPFLYSSGYSCHLF